MTEAALMNRLTTEIRELKPLLHQHLVDEEGDMQPYILMAEVALWAQENSTQVPDRVSQLMRLLEREYATGEADIQDLIGVGFVEMLPESPEGDAVLGLLGPRLRELAEDMHLFDS